MSDYCQLCNTANGLHTHYCPANPANEQSELASATGSVMSSSVAEAIERIMTLAGIAMQPGWEICDSDMPWKLDEAREVFERWANETSPNDKLSDGSGL